MLLCTAGLAQNNNRLQLGFNSVLTAHMPGSAPASSKGPPSWSFFTNHFCIYWWHLYIANRHVDQLRMQLKHVPNHACISRWQPIKQMLVMKAMFKFARKSKQQTWSVRKHKHTDYCTISTTERKTTVWKIRRKIIRTALRTVCPTVYCQLLHVNYDQLGLCP